MSRLVASTRGLALALLVAAGCSNALGQYEASPACGNSGICTHGEQRSCYGGPSGTDGVGVCKGGTQTCNEGTWGACVGEVLPAPDDCAAPTSFSCSAGSACGSMSAPESPFGDTIFDYVSADGQGNLAFALTRGDASLRSYSVEKRAPDGAMLWSVAASPENLDCADFRGIVHTPDDDVIVFGWYGRPTGCSIDLGTGLLPPTESSAFVARYAGSDGTPRWVRTYPWEVNGLAVDASGAIVIGGEYVEAGALGALALPAPAGLSAGYVARLDGTGEPTWVKTFDDEGVERVAADGTGAVFSLRRRLVQSAADECAAGATLVLSAFEADGAPRFEKVLGDAAARFSYHGDIAVDASGRLAITASSTIDALNGKPLPLDLDGVSVDGSAYLAVLDPAHGEMVWARSLFDWLPGTVLFDAHGNVILAGLHQKRVTVARFAPDGAPFSQVSSTAETDNPDTNATRTGDRVWVTVSFLDGPGFDAYWTGALLHADP